MQLAVAPEKCFTKVLQPRLTFFDIYPFNSLNVLSPNITTEFLLFELMSWLLID